MSNRKPDNLIFKFTKVHFDVFLFKQKKVSLNFYINKFQITDKYYLIKYYLIKYYLIKV